MTMASPLPTCSLIDTPTSLANAIDILVSLPRDPPSLFVDLEGNNLSREGTLSLITIFAAPRNHVYIIDVFKMKANTFSTTRARGTTTLKKLLESATIPKVFFDVRNDSDALYSLYGVELRGVQDLQLMELGCRPGDLSRKRYVASLAKCIEHDAGLDIRQKIAWKSAKTRMATMFNVTRGNSTHIFNQRPLAHDAIQYCADDVRFLPRLRNVYWSMLNPVWRSKVEKETKARVATSQKSSYVPHGPHKALGPWKPKALKAKVSLSDEERDLEDMMMERDHGGDFESEMIGELDTMYMERDAKHEKEEALLDDIILELNARKLDDGDKWWESKESNDYEDWTGIPDRLRRDSARASP